MDNEELGEITFNLDVHGRHIADHLPAVELKGLIASIDYSRYQDMKISHWTENTNKADLMERFRLDDPNGSIYLNGDVNVASKVPTFNFLAVVNKYAHMI